jgi:uncharacterized protein (TIGR02145 family)
MTGQPSVGVIPVNGSTVKMQSDKFITDNFIFNTEKNNFKYLASNTLYSDKDTLYPLLNTATPILNPSTGIYESSFIYDNTLGNKYLYLVWDYTDFFEFDLCYNLNNSLLACDCNECPDCISGTEVTIGTQLWTGCNLDVTTYRDGTTIPQVTDPTAWAALTTGAWCYYDNDSANGPTYGKLYNWYAVNDPRGLAPVGYHVPTDSEWTVLTDYLGGTLVAGGKMKEAGLCHWAEPNTDATNESLFTGLAGGYRDAFGTFSSIGIDGYLWSSSDFSTTNALYRYITSFTGSALANSTYKQASLAVRLIKDETCIVGFSTTNLNVTTYNDSTPLVDGSALSNAAWAALTEGAWCYPDGNMANAATYGRIYNWYAAAGIYDAASLADPALRKNIAPVGSHVPSIAEWDAAITCLGGVSVAAGKLKEAGFTHWLSPNTGATNSSGFTGLPGGIRFSSGFNGLGTQGNFYAKDKPDPTHARYYGLFNTGAGIGTNNNPEYIGCSIRTKID